MHVALEGAVRAGEPAGEEQRPVLVETAEFLGNHQARIRVVPEFAKELAVGVVDRAYDVVERRITKVAVGAGDAYRIDLYQPRRLPLERRLELRRVEAAGVQFALVFVRHRLQGEIDLRENSLEAGVEIFEIFSASLLASPLT